MGICRLGHLPDWLLAPNFPPVSPRRRRYIPPCPPPSSMVCWIFFFPFPFWQKLPVMLENWKHNSPSHASNAQLID